MVAATMVTGGIYSNMSRSGVHRVHVIAYADFVLGLNGKGELARGMKIGLVKDKNGVIWVATCYPVEAGAGT